LAFQIDLRFFGSVNLRAKKPETMERQIKARSDYTAGIMKSGSDPDFPARLQDAQRGSPVFEGTGVPVQTLLDCLEAGDSIDDFLEGFPSVKRQQVIAFLEEAKLRLTDDIVRDTIEKTRR
jgi:uncharacterized protein (DUF433 family)